MIKMLELFGGIGAPRKAFQNLGVELESVDYVEITERAVKGYNATYGENYVPKDITKWHINPEAAVDILVHGSPCVDFSKNGSNDLSKGRSILYTRTLEIIEKEIKDRPKVVVWENVANLASKRHFEHLKYYLDTMESFGYKSYWKILDASEYGIPHSRERLYTVSILGDAKFEFPEAVPLQTDIRGYLDMDADFEANALTENEMGVFFRNESGKLCAREATKLGYKEVDEFDTVNVEFPNSKTRRGRVRKGVVGTLCTCPRWSVYYDDKIRLLTAKEHLRLLGFDDSDYEAMKETGLSERQISILAGNSICVPVLEKIFDQLFACGALSK